MSKANFPMRTALFDLHLEAGAKMVEFAGWLMPVQYTGIIPEHRAIREAGGVFDLSHMGRLYLSGPNAASLLQLLTTNDVAQLNDGRAQYSLLCNEAGGVRDDVLVYRLGQHLYLMVVNASNREKVLGCMDEARSDLTGQKGTGITIEDRTLDSVMIGVQGRSSPTILQPLIASSLDKLAYYHSVPCTVLGEEGLLSRTGYTGEDGFEVILPIESGRKLWKLLAASAVSTGLVQAGLGARDTLRLEAAMPLYGHEIDESINPFEARLGKFVQMEKGDFIGRDALRQITLEGPQRRLIGLEITDRAIARQGAPVLLGTDEVGQITSGSYSPTLGRSIAMALVTSDAASASYRFDVLVRGEAHKATAALLPFYRRRKI